MPEHDPNPFDDYSFDHGTTMNPLPAAEVRRRGNRLRRRRSAAAIVGAAAAAAILVATPLALLRTDGDQRGRPDGTDTATQAPERNERDLLTSIPDDVDLTVGIERGPSGDPVRQSGEDPGVGGMQFCDTALLDGDSATDRLAVTGGPGEAAQVRELLVYPNDAAADAAVDAVIAGVRACPEEPFDGTTWLNATAESTVAGGSPLVTQEIVVQGAVRAEGFWQLIRVGNALLVNHRSGEGISASQADEEGSSLTPLLAQLCVFSAQECATPGTAESTR